MSKDKRNPIIDFSSPVEEAHVLYYNPDDWTISVKHRKYDGTRNIIAKDSEFTKEIKKRFDDLIAFIEENVVIE